MKRRKVKREPLSTHISHVKSMYKVIEDRKREKEVLLHITHQTCLKYSVLGLLAKLLSVGCVLNIMNNNYIICKYV